MLAAHFEQVRNLVPAEPARQADEPLISRVLNTDPALHAARSKGKTGAERQCSGTRTRFVRRVVAAATVGGSVVSGRDASRSCYSPLVEYTPSVITADGEYIGASAGAAPAPSTPLVAELLLKIKLTAKSIGSNTLENPC